MAKCQECQQEKGCSCTFTTVPNRPYSVCPGCKAKLLEQNEKAKLNGSSPEITQPNVQGV